MSTNENSNGNGQHNAPAFKLQRGSITLAIWERDGEFGPLHSCHLQRSYQDAEQKWQNTTALNGSDLLIASKLMFQADTWIQNRQTQWRNERREQVRPAQPPVEVAPVTPAPRTTVVAPPKFTPCEIPGVGVINVPIELAGYIGSLQDQLEMMNSVADRKGQEGR